MKIETRYQLCVRGKGGGGGICVVDQILQEFNALFYQIQNLQNCYNTPNKNTSKDDI
jgi:hypothetical protein